MIEKIGKFKELLGIRHWVGHGRSWKLTRNINQYPPWKATEAIEDLHEVLAKAAQLGNLAAFPLSSQK